MKKFLLVLMAGLALSFTFTACKGKKDQKVIRIGIIRPNHFGGKMIEKGSTMAIEEINKTFVEKDGKTSGGILGKKIEFVIINDENKADIGKVKLRKAIDSKKLDVIIGGWASAAVLAEMEVMADKKILWLGTGGAAPHVIKKIAKNYDRYKYYFRVGTIDAIHQGIEGANFIIDYIGPKFNKKKVALIGADHKYSKFILGFSKKKLVKAGFEIVYENFLPTSTTDFSPVLSQIRQKKAEIVFQAWPTTESIIFSKQFYAQKVPAILVGAVAESLKDEYFKETNGSCVYEAGFSPQTGPAPITDKTIPFASKFKSKYGMSAGYIAYLAYDAVYILKEAAEKAKSLKSDDLVKIIETNEFKGNMWYDFNDKNHDLKMGIEGDKVYATFIWFQWQPDGTRKAVYPEKFKQADFKLAPWIK